MKKIIIILIVFAGVKLNAQILITKEVCVKFDQAKPYCMEADSVFYELKYLTVMLKDSKFVADWAIGLPGYDTLGNFKPVDYSNSSMTFKLLEEDKSLDINRFLNFTRYYLADYYKIDTIFVKLFNP